MRQVSWILIVPAIVMAILSLWAEYVRRRYVRTWAVRAAGPRPPATVIVPVKGNDEGLRENLAALAAQDYPDYELIVAARDAADIPPGVLSGKVKVVLAGDAEGAASEKVYNLLAAVWASRKSSEILAFSDSDGRVEPGWLRALAAPLDEPGVGASTGYRWYTGRGFWAEIRSAWNSVIAGTLGGGPAPFAWGGSTAIRRQVFDTVAVPEYWKGSISDDYALAAAVRAARRRIVYVPAATVESAGSVRMCEFLSWARRQLMITRFYNPSLWWPGLVAHAVYCGAMAVALWDRSGAALGALGFVLGVGALNAWSRSGRWQHAALAPLTTWIWLITLISSAFGREIEWRGRRYRLARPRWLD